MIEHFLYIYHLDTRYNIPTIPEQLVNNLPSSFNSSVIPLGTAPIQTFQNSGPRTLSVSFQLHRGMFEIENPSATNILNNVGKTSTVINKGIESKNISKMDEMINTLSAMNLPKYTDATKLVTPPSILYRAGNETCIKGVISNLALTSSGTWNKQSKLDVVQVTFTVTETQPYSATYARVAGMLRGISTDLRRSSVWQ